MIGYLNLTSGLEYLERPGIHHCYHEFKLVRIQSSHLESGALWKVIDHLDYGFLIDAALVGVELFDCGSRGGKSPEARACWQGVPWIRYAYCRANTLPVPLDIDRRFLEHFEKQMFNNTRKAEGFRKLKYVWKLTQANDLKIVCTNSKSTHDGDYLYLSKLLKETWHD